jgi:hypothetical protein
VRRLGAAASVVAIGAAAMVPLLPRVGLASSFCNTPTVSGISVNGAQQQFGAAGSTVTVTGSNFMSPLTCTKLQVNIGTASFIVTAQSSTQFSFTSQAGMSGQLSVAAIDNQNPPQATAADSHLIFVTTPTGGSLDNTTPTTGATVHLSGSYFDFHLQPGWEQYGATYRMSNGSGCPGSPSAAPSFADDQHLNVPMPSQFCDGSVTVTLSAPLDAGNPSGSRMSFQLPAATFDIAPKPNAFGGSYSVGQTATVTGSGFGPGPGYTRGAVSVNGIGASVSSWTDGSVSFVVPGAAINGSAVQLTRPYDNLTFSVGSLNVNATVGGLSPAKAAVGDAVTITGSGFGTQPGSVNVNSTQATVTSWSPSSIGFTVPAGATTGPVSVSPGNTNAPASTPTLTLIPKITGITPTHAAPGALIEIDGTTFGTQQGAVDMGGQSAQVTLWGDKSVLAVVPGLAPGSTTVTVAPPGTDAASSPFTVDAPPPPSPSASPGSSGSSGSSGSTGSSGSGSKSSSSSSSSSGGTPATAAPSFIAPSPSGPIIAHGPVPFFRPSPPPGPVSLRLQSAANQTDPGGSVNFTVTLIAFGKPIVGAPVDMLLVIEPGTDASIVPAHAVTDANGQVQGSIRLSKTPGDHIVLARSGIYSDEIRVVGGRNDTKAVAAANQLSEHPAAATPPLLAVRSPVLWALISCLLLFGIGFGLNLVTAPGAAEPGGVAGRRSLGSSLRAGAGLVGDVARVVGGLAAVVGAQVVGAVRRARG